MCEGDAGKVPPLVSVARVVGVKYDAVDDGDIDALTVALTCGLTVSVSVAP